MIIFTVRSNPTVFTRKGFTLPEMMVATALSAILLTVVTATIMTMLKGSESLINYTEMNTQTRHTLDVLGRNLRSVNNVLSATSSELKVTRINDMGVSEEVTYTYDSGAQTLSLRQGGTTQVILRDINTLDFTYYTLRHAVTVNPLEVKHVQLEAELLRRVLRLSNRNYIISARFMLRNRTVSN